MASIAISIAFILGVWLVPATGINDLLLSMGLKASPLTRALVGQVIQYVIPAIFFYWLMTREAIRSHVKVTKRALWILRICNTVSIAFVIAWLVAASTPGGGPGFVVSQLSIVTIFPAVAASMVVLLRVARRSYGPVGLKAGIVVGILLLGTVPLRWYMQRVHSEYVWEQYCEQSVDKFMSKPVDFKVLQFRGVGEIEVFTSVVSQSYAEAHRERIGSSLIERSLLQEYEDVDPDGSRPSKRFFYANGVQEEPLVESQATHSVSISFPQSEVPGFHRLRILVVDVRTGVAIAESNRVVDNFGERKRVCGVVDGGRIAVSDFVVKALELDPRT